MADLGRILIIAGALALGIGTLLLLADRLPWFGKLPGDIFFKRENVSFYFPLTTCIILSALLSLLLWLFRK